MWHLMVVLTCISLMCSIQSAKTRLGADRGSDHELLIAKFRLKWKKVGKTNKPFRYDVNQIPYNYTVEVTNRFKELDLIVPGEGNGTPLQYSCLENPMDRGAWWAAGHGVAKSQTRLSDFTFTFNGNPLQCSCLENPRDGAAWWADVYGVTQGQTGLK